MSSVHDVIEPDEPAVSNDGASDPPLVLARRGALPRQTERARLLRQSQTEAERVLWTALRRKQLAGFSFRRQHPIGPYIVDFCCPAAGLIVEVDGAVHDRDENRAYDGERSAYLEALGYSILRVRNELVIGDVDAARGLIRIALELRSHSLSLEGES